MDKTQIILLVIWSAVIILYIGLFIANREKAKKRIKEMTIYVILVFLVYKIIGDHFPPALIPPLVLLPFVYRNHRNMKKDK
ncbi:hypothetical protein R9X47_01585 [Wukongibacter baidiensis]|uniref:hypothetical protein n=1 Tax=Wukongibacter baidiensis TaxID=1723361 RepID=UPI003D7FFEAF